MYFCKYYLVSLTSMHSCDVCMTNKYSILLDLIRNKSLQVKHVYLQTIFKKLHDLTSICIPSLELKKHSPKIYIEKVAYLFVLLTTLLCGMKSNRLLQWHL